MEFNVKKVTEFLSQWFELEKFYSLSFSRGGNVVLQGEYKSKVVKRTMEVIGECKTHVDENGFLSISFEFEGIKYNIVFTTHN